MNMISESPIIGNVAAVSVGLVKSETLLDLCYIEDSHADVDMNIVMRGNDFVEIQGTAEGSTFDRDAMNQMIEYATKGISELIAAQNNALLVK